MVEIRVGKAGDIGEDSVGVCGACMRLPQRSAGEKNGAAHVDA